MTDDEFIKAFELCFNKENCSDCPLFPSFDCEDVVNERILEIVKCQKAKIEELETARRKQGQFLSEERAQKYELIDKLSIAKLEAVREFAERLKKEALVSLGYEVLPSGTIDGLVEEIKSTHENLKKKKN